MSKYLCILFLLITLSSCKYRTDNFTLNESEFYIDDQTESISSDALGCIWVGTENGDIYSYNNENLIHYDLKEDKIYKASLNISKNGDTLLWVASRNAGLQVWNIKDVNNPIKIKSYTIDKMGENYSPYDFVFINKDVYVSTSHGFYKTQIDNSGVNLTLVYPSKEELSKYPGSIYVFRNLCLYNDSVIYAASIDGVKAYNIYNGQTKTILNGNNIEHVAIYSDTLFVTSKNELYRIDSSQKVLKNNIEKQISMFFRDVNGNNFLIGNKNILLTKDFKKYTDIKINKEIPINSNIHNLMVSDKNKAFSYLITNNALWRIASHINIFSGKNISASCVNENGDIYYITGLNELYIKKKNSSEAKWIFSFKEEDPIIWMDIYGNELYLHSSSNSFYKIKLQDQWFENIISSPKKLFKTSSKITATHLHKYGNNPICYIGTQEGLFYLSNDSIKLVPYFSGTYITSFFETKNTDRIYIATLNDGVYFAGHNFQNFKQIPESSHISFIKDIIATNDHRSNLVTLTNQRILFDDDSSVKAKGIKKLIYINDTCFVSIPSHGLNMYAIRNGKVIYKGNYFEDISFNPNACLMANDSLILGSGLGSLTISPLNMDCPKWTIFGEIVNIEVLSIISLILLFFIVHIIYLIRIYFTKNTELKNAQLIKLRDDQINRIEDVQSFIDLSSDSKLNQEISNIKNYLDLLNVEEKTQSEKKEIKKKLDEISIQIANINRKISIHIPFKISRQKELLTNIKNVEAENLIDKIEKIRDSDNVILIYNTIRENQIWIDRYKILLHDIDIDIESISKILVISNLNEGIYNKLIELKKNLPDLYLDEIASRHADLRKRIEDINSANNRILIANAIEQIKNRLLIEIITDKKLTPLDDYLNTIKEPVDGLTDNILILKRLKLLDEQLRVLKVLNEIKDYTNQYRKSTDRIIKENNERINKKNELDLNSEIETKNQALANKINNLIIDLYNILPSKDSDILTDILKINNKNSQNAKVLALLLADKRIKRTLIPKILGIFGNLNPVVSRLLSDRIKPNTDHIKQYKKENGISVFIIRLTDLIGEE